MAPKRGKETPLELCSQASMLGNTISVRILEYLSTGKNEPHNFRQLAADFLDICHTIWSIEVGLSDLSQKHSQFPVDLFDELGRKIRSVTDDFSALNQMLLKFLEGERKGGLRRGWRMMFADTDIDNIRKSLAKSQEGLRMSAMMFRWSVGDQKTDGSIGIGYTALSAALGRPNNQSTPAIVSAPLPPVPSHVSPPHSPGPPTLPLPSPPEPLMGRTPTNSLLMRHEDHFSHPSVSSGHLSVRSGPRSDSHTSTTLTNSPVLRKDAVSPIMSARNHNASETTVAMTTIEDMIHDMDLEDKMPSIQEREISETDSAHTVNLDRVRLLPTNSTARQSSGFEGPTTRVALRNAIQHNKHHAVEHVLTNSVPADAELTADNLKIAIMKRDPESVRLLLQYGADPNSLDKDGLAPLHSATESSFLRAAEILLDHGADPNIFVGPETDSPWVMAINTSKYDFVQLFLQHGGNVDSAMADGDTVLIKVMDKSTPAHLVEAMLKHGANPNDKNGEGVSPLFAAIQAKRVDLITLLLERGANPNLPGPKHPLWPSTYQPKALQALLNHGADLKKCSGILELAASINNRESISILINAGVDINARKDGVYTPLCTAIRDNRSEIVSLLLANGADPNHMASEYPAFKCVTHHRTHFLPQLAVAGADLHTPKGIIEKAIAHNNKDALMWLLKQGVNPNDRSPEGNTALTTAIRDNKVEFIDILLAHGANPAIRGQDWPITMGVKRPQILAKLLPHISNPRSIPKGVVEMAVVANELDSVKLLLQAGVSVEDKNGGVFSPLTTALRERNTEIVRFLLDEAGADPNAPGEHLPIIKAIRRVHEKDYENIELLLERGADVNLIYRGWNAVLQAVENGDADILKLLVERGGTIDLEAENEEGRTVMEVVEERGWQEAVDILHECKVKKIQDGAL